MDATAWAQLLASVLGGILIGGLGYLYGSKGKQSVIACDERCKARDAAREKERLALERQIAKNEATQSTDTALIMRMLRAVIMHLPLSDTEKADIINDRGRL
jgi:hypothetical protein